MDAQIVTKPQAALVTPDSKPDFPFQREAEQLMTIIRSVHDSVAGKGASATQDPIDLGWSITLTTETMRGYVGVESDWRNVNLCLSWTKSALVDSVGDKKVAKILGLKNFKHDEPGRQWGKFASAPLGDQNGRVWVDDGRIGSWTPREFRAWDPEDGGKLRLALMGAPGGPSRSLATVGYDNTPPTDNNSPNCNPAVLSTYKARFLALAVAQAGKMGGAKSFTIDHKIAIAMTPDDLAPLGYVDETVRTGNRQGSNGFGGDIVTAVKQHELGTERVVLVSANSVYEWSVYRHFELGAQIQLGGGNALPELSAAHLPERRPRTILVG